MFAWSFKPKLGPILLDLLFFYSLCLLPFTPVSTFSSRLSINVPLVLLRCFSWPFLSLPLSLTILIHLEITGQLLCRLCFNLGFSDASSWLNLSYTSLVRKSQKWHWVPLTEFSKVSHSSDLTITDIILTTWLRWLLPVFSNIQLLFFPYGVLLYFDAQIVLVLASRSLCTLASVSCWHVPIILQLLPYFLHPQDAPGSSWPFPVPPMESTVLLESGFLVWLLNRWAF